MLQGATNGFLTFSDAFKAFQRALIVFYELTEVCDGRRNASAISQLRLRTTKVSEWPSMFSKASACFRISNLCSNAWKGFQRFVFLRPRIFPALSSCPKLFGMRSRLQAVAGASKKLRMLATLLQRPKCFQTVSEDFKKATHGSENKRRLKDPAACLCTFKCPGWI